MSSLEGLQDSSSAALNGPLRGPSMSHPDGAQSTSPEELQLEQRLLGDSSSSDETEGTGLHDGEERDTGMAYVDISTDADDALESEFSRAAQRSRRLQSRGCPCRCSIS